MEVFQRAAHGYAERGWPVLPLEPRGKKPIGYLVPHGVRQATLDHKLIQDWWRENPQANIGLRTGACFDALDCDGEGAMAAFPPDRRSGEPPIMGPTVLTGRGWHCYVQPSGAGNRKLAEDLDLKGRRGYVLAPPSVHPSGAIYCWWHGEQDPLRGIDAPIEPAPGWLVGLIFATAPAVRESRAAPSFGRFAHPRAKQYGRGALVSELRRLTSAEEGERNHSLNKAAFRLGQLVRTGILEPFVVLDSLLSVAEWIGLPRNEAEPTIVSGLRAGTKKAR